MSNQEILEKAIRKAIEGGWVPFTFQHPIKLERWEKGGLVELGVVYEDRDDPVAWVRELEGIIFNHDFARALWGDETENSGSYLGNLPNWQYHLQQMVIAEDPIKYLGENI